ncbi:MAG TPA: sigma-54 dependent transcriptional regulator [Phycisphaerae bacterium]
MTTLNHANPAQANPLHEYYVLIVEDDANQRQTLAQLLGAAGYRVSTADSADKALSYLNESVHFVITDLEMGDVSGLDLLKYWKAKSPETMFLMITGHGSTQSAIDAIKAGAYHYMTKPLDVSALLIMIQNMVRQREDTRKVAILQNRLDDKFSLSNIIGRSPQMQRVFELIRRSAQAFSTVLILGESGTGKELVAEAIHQHSPRRNGPFNAVNCAAMPATLVESELFGHEKGSFTGATERRTGRFEAAHGGTLFIDEIGDFDISLQVKLLRVMENRTVTAIGSTKEIKVDTRVLAATSRDIRDMIAKGTFREDLYYRLNVITIELPPLRQRLDDIPLLVKRFMDRVNTQNGSNVTAISPDVIDLLQKYHWPGNVRELLNIIERMIVLSDKEALDVDDLPLFIRKPNGAPVTVGALAPATAANSNGNIIGVPSGALPAHAPAPPAHQAAAEPKLGGDGRPGVSEKDVEQLLANKTLEELENLAIAAALRRFHNHRTRAAQALGISVRTLQRKLGPHQSEPAGPESDEPVARVGVMNIDPSSHLAMDKDYLVGSSTNP